MKRMIALLLGASCVAACSLQNQPAVPEGQREPGHAYGFVYNDKNGNGVRDPGEPGLAHVPVSNGKDVVATDRRGAYKMPVTDDCILFVIKPSGWMTPIDDHNLPQFYYIHKPDGSPDGLKYAGVAPTGPLPDSVDFALHKRAENDQFKVLLFGDPQPYRQEEVDYFAHGVVEELIGKNGCEFGVTLGDIIGDDLDLFGPYVRTVACLKKPWYNVIGNHDMNYMPVTDRYSDETYERVFGPSTYAFNFGNVHFIVLDDVIWEGSSSEPGKGKYRAGFTDEQIEFVRNDLARVPKDFLVVPMMHIPLTRGEVQNRAELFDVLADHPHVVSLSAHWHMNEHWDLDSEYDWPSEQPHHHATLVTASGSWHRGNLDELGIPHTTMRDGAPNGYTIMTVDGHRYSLEYHASRRRLDYQMNIWAPEVVRSQVAANTEVLANVFGGSGRSQVEMRLDDGPWVEMKRERRIDPYYQAALDREKGPFGPAGKLPDPQQSSHIWVAKLPANPQPGSRVIHVRTTDMFGQTYEAHRIIRVE